MVEPNKFYHEIEEIIVHWKHFDPIRCFNLGIHDYDGLLPDYSVSGIKNRIQEVKEDIVHLIALKRDYNDPYTLFEFNLLKLALEEELYELDSLKEYSFNPLFFIRPFLIIEQSFTKKFFASVNTRIEIITRFLTNTPKFLSYPKEHLLKSLPSIHLEISIRTLSGVKNFFSTQLDDFIYQSQEESLITEYFKVKELALSSITDFLSTLITNFRPDVHTKYALGKDKFLTMLKKREFVTIDELKLRKLGEDELQKNFSTLQSILKKHPQSYLNDILNDIPDSIELFSYASSVLDRLLNFLKSANIVDIPTEEQCKIGEMPESIRGFGFGLLHSPGPFESFDVSSYFYLTPPDSNWTAEQRLNYMKFFNRASFEIIAINEIWPGEYLKIAFERKRTKSIISKLFSRSESMIQGYPSYAQEMMLAEHYNPWPNDPDKIIIGHLLISLLRNVRFVVSVGIHCFNMTTEEAMKLFIEKAFLSKESALMEVNRVIVSPMVLNYTLGKLLIKKLLEDYKLEHEANFSISKFHNELLSYGSPPITILRQVMIKNPKLVNEVL